MTITIYLEAFLIPMLVPLTGIAVSAFIPLGLYITLTIWIIRQEAVKLRNNHT